MPRRTGQPPVSRRRRGRGRTETACEVGTLRDHPGLGETFATCWQIENGCAPTDPVRACPAPVRGLTITLNDDVVFQNDDDLQPRLASPSPSTPSTANDNSLVLAAKGAPRSGSPRAHPRPPPTRQTEAKATGPQPACIAAPSTVGADGNGVRGRPAFATTLAGRDVRYVLRDRERLRTDRSCPACPAPVREPDDHPERRCRLPERRDLHAWPASTSPSTPIDTERQLDC